MKDQAPDIVDDLRWISPPRDLAFNPWYLAGGILLLLLVIAVALWLVRRRKKLGSIFPSPTAQEKALKALHALTGLIREESDQEFVLQVSLIIRGYIQERFGLRAPHRSTEEFLNEARSSELLAPGHQELLQPFLMQCDLVKFALQRAVIPQMKELHQSALRFVEGTTPAVPDKSTGVQK